MVIFEPMWAIYERSSRFTDFFQQHTKPIRYRSKPRPNGVALWRLSNRTRAGIVSIYHVTESRVSFALCWPIERMERFAGHVPNMSP